MNARVCTPSMAITPIWTLPDGETLVCARDDGPLHAPIGIPTPLKLPGDLKIEAATGGLNHSLVLTTDGRLFTWGRNGDGQLGRQGECLTPGEVVLP
jgi:alpha-tubulin suppressor-like RCC1 family protein